MDKRTKEERIQEAKSHHHSKQNRKYEAEKRKDEASKLTPQEKLQKLDNLLGKNIGATKERTRLLKRIYNDNQTSL